MNDWPTATLEELCAEGGGFVRTGPFGSQLHQSDYIDDPNGIPVVMPKDMVNGRVDHASVARISTETAERLAHHLTVPGDIVLARRGDVGRSVSIRPSDIPALVGTGSVRIHLGTPERVDPRYFEYFMRSRHVVDYLEGQAVGATMPNLNAGIVNSLPVFIPPLAHQRNTAEALGSIDDLIENNRRRIEVLEEMAQAIYREWFVHFRFPGHQDATFVDSPLGPIPEGWEIHPLSHLATVVRGRSYRKYELAEEGGLPFVNLKCMMRGGGFRMDGLKRYTGDYKPQQLVSYGDIVLAVTDLTQGREILAQATLVPRMAEEVGVISLDVARIVPIDVNNRLPLFFSLRSSDFADRVKEYANGSTVLHLSPKFVEQNELVWPDLSLRSAFTDVVKPMVASLEELRESAERLAAIRDLLLPKLVTGEIDVSDLDLDGLVGAAS